MSSFLWLGQVTQAVHQHQVERMKSLLQSECIVYEEGRMTHDSPMDVAIKILEFISGCEYCAILAPHNPHWLRVLSILSSYLNCAFISGMKCAHLPACERVMCANRVFETVDVPEKLFCATLVPEEPSMAPGLWSVMSSLIDVQGAKLGGWRGQFEPFLSEGVPLDGARVVFAGGRGLGSQASFEKLARCASKYGAGVAGSRLAVDMGWCRSDIQVGQTGRSVSSEIYVAFGISGAIQHLAGIQNVHRLIAVNTDKDAPIYQFADEGVIADANEVIDYLLKA